MKTRKWRCRAVAAALVMLLGCSSGRPPPGGTKIPAQFLDKY